MRSREPLAAGPRVQCDGKDARRSSGTGFTLIELVVVLAIIGLAAAVAVPALDAALRARTDDGPAERLASVLEIARGEAARGARPVCVDLRPADGAYRVVAGQGSRDSVVAGGVIEGWRAPAEAAPRTCFLPDGTAAASAWEWPGGGGTVRLKTDPLDGSIKIER